MRAPFNTTADFYQGPNGASPGFFIGTFDVRFVQEDGIFTTGAGVPEIPYYLTIADYEPRGCFTVPFFGVDPDIADRVVVATQPGVEYWILYTVLIVWENQLPYFRAYLAELPAPDTGPQGGVVLGGLASVSSLHEVIGIGGILLGGAAGVAFNDVVVPSGGLLLGGTAAASSSFVIPEPAGGLLLGGTATVVFTPGIIYYWRDTFTDADGTLLTAHVPEVGGAYTMLAGTMKIHGNQLVTNSTSPPTAIAQFNPGQSTCKLDVDWLMSTNASGAGDRYIWWQFRNLDENNKWFAFANWPNGFLTASTVFIYKGTAGVFVPVTSFGVSLSENVFYHTKITLTPTTVKLDVDFYTSGTITDSTHGAQTKFQLGWNTGSFSNSMPKIDNVIVTP